MCGNVNTIPVGKYCNNWLRKLFIVYYKQRIVKVIMQGKGWMDTTHINW